MKRKVVFIFLITCLRFLFAHDYKYLDNVKTKYKLVKIPEKKIYIGITEVTQSLYQEILGVNPSWYCYNNPNLIKLKYELEDLKKLVGDDTGQLPVESISWYDAIYFCNKLSEKCNLTPVYSIKGETDVSKWEYIPADKPHWWGEIEDYEYIEQNLYADGYRLPTKEEWMYALNPEEYTKNNIHEYAWQLGVDGYTHPVGLKKSNLYGLYDMIGNVEEYCWDSDPNDLHGKLSIGLYSSTTESIINENYNEANVSNSGTGIRIVCSFNNPNIIVNKIMIINENLRLRNKEETSSKVITIMQAGTKVKILAIGKSEEIDGIISNWVKVEIQEGAKDKNNKKIKAGTIGWCYGGYLR